MTTTREPFDSRDLERVALLWLGLLGPPLVFLTNLELGYALVNLVCGESRLPHAVLHVVHLALLAVVIGLGVLSWRNWQRVGGHPSADDPTPDDRSRLIAMLGVLSAAFFGLIMLAQLIPVSLLNACLRAT